MLDHIKECEVRIIKTQGNEKKYSQNIYSK